jgi:predicted house-cleaning noncanonical NTP pyrophosphatase (MazG superfamily)
MSDGEFRDPTSRQQHRTDRTLSEETVFEVLSNGRRRFVFHYLKGEQRQIYLRELAEHVAAWENDKSVEQLTSAEAKRVKTALHQHHLPMMDSNGFVEYDSMRETVVLDESVADLEVYLDVVPAVEMPWSRYYLGLSVVGLLALGCALLDTGPFAWISGLSAATFITVIVLISALVHTYLNHTRLRLGGTGEPPEMSEQ